MDMDNKSEWQFAGTETMHRSQYHSHLTFSRSIGYVVGRNSERTSAKGMGIAAIPYLVRNLRTGHSTMLLHLILVLSTTATT